MFAPEPTADTRREALLAVLWTRHGGVPDSLLGLHPEAAVLASTFSDHVPRPLQTVLQEEMAKALPTRAIPSWLHRIAAGHPLNYWCWRRYWNNKQTWQDVEERTPDLWKRLSVMTKTQVDGLCTAVGMEMIGQAVLTEPRDGLIRQLAHLGVEAARCVAGQLRRLCADPVPRPLAKRWLRDYSRLAKSVNRQDVARTLGKELLATSLLSLESDLRQALAGISLFDFEEMLRHAQVHAMYPAETGQVVESLLSRLMSACESGDGSLGPRYERHECKRGSRPDDMSVGSGS